MAWLLRKRDRGMNLLGYYLKKLFTIFRGEVLVLPSRIVVFLFFLVLLLLPVVTQDPYVLRILILTSIFAIFASAPQCWP